MSMKTARIILVLSLSLLGVYSGRAQYSIQIQVDSMPTSKAYLYEFSGLRVGKMLDSVYTPRQGQINFSLPAAAHPGMYRVVMGPRTWLDFIFNRENIRLKTHFAAPVDSLKVIQSVENGLWNEYMNYFMILNRKQEYLSRLKSLYQPQDPFYQAIEKELAGMEQSDPESVSRRIIETHPKSYVARFLRVELSPQVPVGLSLDEERDYVLSHFFDGVDFMDSALIYSPPLMSRVNSYFGLIQQAFPPVEVEEQMIQGLNRLMSKAAVNTSVFDFLLEELARLFERSEFEIFFAYFTENYLLEASCKDETRNQELAEILASIQKTALGKTAPEIVIPQPEGPLMLSTMNKANVLVLFWASWCPHCQEMLPEIKQIYNQYKAQGFEVLAISLDLDAQSYQAALQKGQYGWINYSELKGWDSSIARDYGIRATPSLILLDKNRRIIGKPRNPEHLKQMLAELY